MALRGSCLCGRVGYEVAGEFRYVRNCHCANCRKAHGAAFATFGAIARESWRIVSGAESIARYQSSPEVSRALCRHCGSNLCSEVSSRADTVHFRLGTLDDDPGIKPSFHAYVARKAPWHDITDSLPQHPGLPESS